jgi:hypothetical protein
MVFKVLLEQMEQMEVLVHKVIKDLLELVLKDSKVFKDSKDSKVDKDLRVIKDLPELVLKETKDRQELELKDSKVFKELLELHLRLQDLKDDKDQTDLKVHMLPT